MTAKLIDLGRNKVNKTIEVKNTKELHKIIGSHLLSNGWGMYETDTPNKYYIEAGFRTVGYVEIISE